ncbi:MAG: hypothetical protein F7B06_00415 [Opitutae bacterium]|nr:hypothetical protein [Opitutae bacterium]MBC9888327.1 hypothetical protein [Opitutae bacterium]
MVRALTKSSGIVEREVVAAQKIWGEAIVAIGEAYMREKDYKALAEKVVDTLYGYGKGVVLFKPSMVSEKQFRLTKQEALSYFVTGIVPEDRGFAIQPWRKVRFENEGIIIDGDSAIVMGNYYFTDANSEKEAKVEFTFGYFKDENGKLRINVHHSSFPYGSMP